jgi:hypothetical protein
LKLSCIYCLNETFDQGKGSEEHAILSSLGGRKSSRNVCCSNCNNRLGKEIDESCSEALSFFSTMLDITTGRNKPAPTQRSIGEHEGKSFDIFPGGEIKFSKSDVDIQEENGKAEISITANSESEALNILSVILKKYGKSIDDFTDLEAKSVKSYIPSVHQRLELGGEKQLRSIAKMALTYLATFISPERLRSSEFKPIIEYINKEGVENNFVSFSTEEFPSNKRQISEINHRLIISACDESNKVNAVLELYGNIRFLVTLTDNWSGPNVSKEYIVDPVTKNSEELTSSNTGNIFCLSHQNTVDYNSFKQAVGNIVQSFQNRQMDGVISKITDKAIEKHMVGKGEIITEEMISAVASEVALEFTRRMYRIDHEEVIDLAKLNKSKQGRRCD